MTANPGIGVSPPELVGRRSECRVLDGLVAAARAGESRALVVRGDPGVGKTALLDYVARHASGCRVIRTVGVQSEMELAFAALHQLLSPVLDRLDGLPAPQRDALSVAFGIAAGPAPDRFLVGLAVLGLLSDASERQPLVCVLDDEQWLDRASAQVLAFVARRVYAESVVLVFATRKPSDDLRGLPELVVEGLHEADARVLLDSVLAGPVDARVRDRLVSEARGNPLALLELPRDSTPAKLAGGFGLPDTPSLLGELEEAFSERIEALPAPTRRLVALAAADPVGDPLTVWRAAKRLGIPTTAATPAAEDGLLEIDARVRFRHPLVRSAAYGAVSFGEQQELHRALAEVTDARLDPDRRAWHRAQAAPGPDEDVAAELEHSAGRAQARGGLAAAAAFLERGAMLTPEPTTRTRRMLAAATAKHDAGALDESTRLLNAIETGSFDTREAAEALHLRGQIALDERRGTEAVRLLVEAARGLTTIDVDRARETYLEALLAAMWAGDLEIRGGLRGTGEAARAAPTGSQPPRTVDVLVDAFALRLTDGFSAAAPAFARAVELLLALNVGSDESRRWLWLVGARASGLVAMEVWDFEAWHALAAGQVQVARDLGALVHLQFALTFLVVPLILRGDLTAAARLIEEDRMIAEATGNPPVAHTTMLIAAWRGQEAQAGELIESIVLEATALGLGRLVNSGDYASAVLHNGLGRHDVARDAAWRAFEHDAVGHGSLVVSELAEAAARTGDRDLVEAGLQWLCERTRVRPTDWAAGIEARVRALLSTGSDAERCYEESIERLGRTPIRAELARTRLLYGEWLRRERRRIDAREQLRAAHEMLDAMGIEAFAERARRELLATGETARRRTVETRDELTAQETQIARFARDGLSNPEIGARLFISPRTVKYHLSKVFTKLDISSRSELRRALPVDVSDSSAVKLGAT
jgi:DNA-binding CsgD family transcriptional regulator